ncbi:putative lipoprotein YerB [Lachnospiraceae bacterium]|nr:putative lipoprotein YerB [Lachnospiraceae bacterium]
MSKRNTKLGRGILKKAAAVMLAAVTLVGMPANGVLPTLQVQADEALPGYIRSVYTNEWVPAEQAVVRPIAVMMPTDKVAQPSYGISNADILYEIMEEGEISRQMAVISNWTGLSKIGNVRSCRAYYLPEATEWDPIIVHFGGVFYMKDRITAPDINNISGTNQYGTGGGAPGSGAFFRTSDRKAPHNAYTSAAGIINACVGLGYTMNIREGFYNPKHFTFADGGNTLEQYGAAAATANAIDLSLIFPYTKSAFTYNPADGMYYKNIHGKAQTDGLNGQQLKFANVIVQNTKWCRLDDKGYLYFQNIDNTEDGYYFTKGKCIHVTWQKTGDYTPTVYYDDFGNEIQLNEGKTYIAIAQTGRPVAFQ